MKLWKRLALIGGALSLVVLVVVVFLILFTQLNVNLGGVVFALVSISIFGLLGGGFWVLNQLFSALEHRKPPPVTPHRATRSKAEPAAGPATPRAPAPEAAYPQPTAAWIKEQYPDAEILQAKDLVQAYKNGRRTFQNVFPAAEEPYGHYLMWATFDGADFSRAMLYRAPFDGTSLIGANFNGAYLEGASFKGAVLRQANFNWADLHGADFSGADLAGANLNFASLEGTDFSGAILTGVIVSSEQLARAGSLRGATLPDGRTGK